MTARLRDSLAASLLLLLGTPFVSLVTAAQPRPPSDAETAAGCATCSACGGVMIVVPIAIVVLNIALLVWVARDAKARSMDSAVIWMILVMFTGPIGLVIYLFSRPQGNLIQCPHCRNKRLEASSKCPHCGNA
jgi:small-conductance mechanosensitive channel